MVNKSITMNPYSALTKKSLTILSILAVTSAYSSSVFAASLNISGVLHASVDNVDDGNTASTYLASSSSRLTVSGAMQASSDVEVLFQYETGVSVTGEGFNDGNGPDAGQDGQLFTRARDTYVGLKGDFGQLLLGHHSTGDIWINEFNLFGDQIGDIGNLWAGSGVPGRSDDVIFYSSPNNDGISVDLAYIPEEGVDDSSAIIIKPVYDKDNMRISGAYANFGQGTGNEDHTVLALNVITHVDQFDVGAGFQSESDSGGVAGADRDTFSIGARYNIDAKTSVKFQFTSTEGSAVDTDASLWAVGYDYQLNKKTTLYVAYAATNNDAAASFQVNGKGHGDAVAVAAGDDPSSISFGLVYKFDTDLISK